MAVKDKLISNEVLKAVNDNMQGQVTDLKSAVDEVDNVVFGNNLVDASTILNNNNSAVTNNNNGTYTIGTTDYGRTMFGSQVTLAPGDYLLYGVPFGYSFLATNETPASADIFVKNETSAPKKITIVSTTSCYLGYYAGTRPSSSFTIIPYIKTLGMDSDVAELQTKVDSMSNVVTANSNGIENTKEIQDLTSEFISGGNIVTNISVGSAITFTPTANTGFVYNVQPCKTGDLFFVTGKGGTNPLLWCFVNSAFEVVAHSAEDAEGSSIKLVSPCDGFLIVNANNSYSYALAKKTNFVEQEYTRVSNPHLFFWKMGTFTKDGPQTGTFTDRMYMTCRVKAGSTIIAPTTGGVNISFGYKVDETSTELDYFQSYNYGAVGITQDCTIYVGVLFNTPAFIPNDSLLNNLIFDLMVVDYNNKYSKKDSCAFGNPVDIYYEGQHTDETGWTNATVDIDAIHAAFDALVTASNGYITKTDLGVAYDTYHAFQYSTVPAGLHISGGLALPKVAILCCMHGNEKMSAYAMHYLMYDLVHNSTKNPVLSYLRTNCQIVFIPITNPWGFLNTSRWNENGVNLNRNFPTYNWDEYDDETSVIGGINYKGTAPASEDQTKLMIAFLRKNYDAVFAIDLHTNGTNTSAWYEICTTIIPLDSDTTSENYEIQNSYVNPSKVHINRIKPWFDEKYGTDLGNVFYGNVSAPEQDRPAASQWIRESNNMAGFTFEVLCGSSDNYLGTTLTKYAPATIKAAAEELGNFLVAMLINCKEV